jgi:uncharacterized membrane protein (DUF4010 family)
MSIDELMSRFAVALGIGLLIGLERGWKSREDQPGSRTAGLRTFAITGLLGGTAGALSLELGGPTSTGGGLFLGLCFAGYAGVITVFTRDENIADKTFSATTPIAALVTFALGAFSLVGDIRAAAAAAVATAGLLALRHPLHGWVRRITWEELRSILILLAMTFVVLPVVPNEPVGPFGGLNLREIWLIAIVLAAVSFLGYVAIKYLGARRGVLLAAAAGGLVSSTAVMITNARRAAAGEGVPRLLAAGAMIATCVSLVRTALIVGTLNPPMLKLVMVPLGAAALVSLLAASVLAFRAQSGTDGEEAGEMRNPFEFRPVVIFAIILGLLVIAARLITEQFGAAGAIVAALVTGIGDIDAVTVSMTKLAPSTLDARQAALAVMAAVLSNNVAKAVMGGAIGRGAFAVATGIGTAAALAAGAVAWFVVAPLLG